MLEGLQPVAQQLRTGFAGLLGVELQWRHRGPFSTAGDEGVPGVLAPGDLRPVEQPRHGPRRSSHRLHRVGVHEVEALAARRRRRACCALRARRRRSIPMCGSGSACLEQLDGAGPLAHARGRARRAQRPASKKHLRVRRRRPGRAGRRRCRRSTIQRMRPDRVAGACMTRGVAPRRPGTKRPSQLRMSSRSWPSGERPVGPGAPRGHAPRSGRCPTRSRGPATFLRYGH